MEQVLRPEDLNKVNETLKDINDSLNLIVKAIRELEPFLTDIKRAIVYK